MRLDLRDIIHIPGADRDFACELDLSQVKLSGEKPFVRPVAVSGHVRNMAGALMLTGEARAELDARCDRCLTPRELTLSVPVETLLAEELEDEENDDIVLLEKGAVDVDDIFTTACILALDGKHLCREDCKGLCPKCGADLNDGSCGCTKEVDPRLAVLAKLLDKDSQETDEEA